MVFLRIQSGFILCLLVLFSACSGEEDVSSHTKEAVETPAKAPEAPAKAPAEAPKEKPAEKTPSIPEPVAKAAAIDGPPAMEIKLGPKGNTMYFDQTELRASADKKVRLVFNNTATMPAMQHNVIIVTKGTVDALSKKALIAGTKGGWVPNDPDVLAATGLTKPGESSSVDFVLAAGTYEYFCSYPGHAAMMRGTLIIE